MRNLTLITALLLYTSSSFAQRGDLKTYPSGLIYNDETMKQLDIIVDSLNTQFLSCDLNKTFYAKEQAQVHYVYMKNGNKSSAKADMNNKISYDDFIKKHNAANASENLLLIKAEYTNYEDEKVLEYSSVAIKGRYGNDITFKKNFEKYKSIKKGDWIYTMEEGRLEAFYFLTDMEAKPMIEKYARMVQYSDCMVDTTEQVFRESSSNSSRWDKSEEVGSKIEKFLKIVNDFAKKPKYKDDYEDFMIKQKTRDSIVAYKADEKFRTDEKFKKLYDSAVKEAQEKNASADEFEKYVSLFGDKSVALELKRNRRVYGMCSMDSRPREHAADIAALSAETAYWPIFLRSHLDIMNDRFERTAWSSYGEASFGTYIGELEALNINVPDLMMGISLRVNNPSTNHYYGSINRVGRGLSETKNAQEMETIMLSMIADENLDDYNRVLIYFLYLNYNYHNKDEVKKKANKVKLDEAVAKLPDYIITQIKAGEKEKE